MLRICGVATCAAACDNAVRPLRKRGFSAISVSVRHEPRRDGDVKHSLASIESAERALGFVPRIDLATGIARTVEWHRERRGATLAARGT